MGALDSVKVAIARRRLLANRIPKDSLYPLETWMAIKAVMTAKSERELKGIIGKKDQTDITRKDFDEYQLFRFREQIRYVKKNTPYYEEKLKDLIPENIRTLDDLNEVPFTLPSDLAEAPFSFMAVSRTKLAREFTTTGTTGKRKVIGYTTGDLIAKVDIISSALRSVGMSGDDVLHIMFPAVDAWDPSIMLAGACRVAGYGSSTCSSPDIKEQMEIMKKNGSTHIIGLPSFIYRVTALMGNEIDLKKLGIRKIISTSEPLSESMREKLQNAWGCNVLDVWGMTEFGLACAIECDKRKGLHTDEANLLFEVIDPDTGKRVPDGKMGELVVTALTAEATPLIRYRTRDIAAMISPPCSCGSKFNRKLVKPCGRMDLQFKVGMGYKIFPLLFDEAVFENKDVIDYQVNITKEGFKDVLTFELESKDQSDGVRDSVIAAVSKIMEIDDGIKEDLIEIPRVIFKEIGSMAYSAKAKKIVDLRENFDS
ncbi:MAG: AMP-binding protein [Methanomassiliicoccaceae archaeon]|jgi:phenylacetate-CoA ligase|nr:AMP-binding protein [Methanomassiliicoccaceae archaeon]